MSQFIPYSIIHQDISGITQLPAVPALCYIWWRDIPLGHLWVDKSLPSLDEFRKQVLENVKPALQYYTHTNANSWETYLINGGNEKLAIYLDETLQPAELADTHARTDTISIVICTRNRSTMLRNCIEAIINGTDKNFELIVIDNAPDDDSTQKVVAEFPQATYILEPRKGLDIARNTGARNATHNIIAYTDDDVVVDKNWVSKLKKCFTDPSVLAVTGQVIPLELRTKSQYLFERFWGFNKGYVPKLFDYWYFTEHVDEGVPVWDIGAGANMAFRREVFDIAGWFDERLDVGAAGCSGDSEFWYRILAERWNCYYCPQLYVYHNHRDSDEALEKQVFSYMRGHVAALLVQHEQYGNKGDIKRMYKTLPLHYLWRIRKRMTSGITDDFRTISAEIKGCISGWWFYKSVARKKKMLVDHAQMKFKALPHMPLVSVIITSYNYAQYLPQAIESVLAQTYKNIEIIIVDDSSTDNTQEIIKKHSGIISVITKRVGASAARNIGISHSKGALLVFLDADDYFYPEAVALNVAGFHKHSDSAFVAGAFDKVDTEGNILPSIEPRDFYGSYYLELLKGNRIGMLGNVMYRRELFFSFHFETSLRNCEDYALNLDISRYYPLHTYTTRIIAYRQHKSNKSGNNERMLEAIRKILHAHGEAAKDQETKKAVNAGLEIWRKYYRQ